MPVFSPIFVSFLNVWHLSSHFFLVDIVPLDFGLHCKGDPTFLEADDEPKGDSFPKNVSVDMLQRDLQENEYVQIFIVENMCRFYQLEHV